MKRYWFLCLTVTFALGALGPTGSHAGTEVKLAPFGGKPSTDSGSRAFHSTPPQSSRQLVSARGDSSPASAPSQKHDGAPEKPARHQMKREQSHRR